METQTPPLAMLRAALSTGMCSAIILLLMALNVAARRNLRPGPRWLVSLFQAFVTAAVSPPLDEAHVLAFPVKTGPCAASVGTAVAADARVPHADLCHRQLRGIQPFTRIGAQGGGVCLHYCSAASRQQVLIKMDTIEPSDLPPQLVDAISGSLQRCGVDLVGATVRSGCVELTLDISAMGSGRAGPVPPSTLAQAVLDGLGVPLAVAVCSGGPVPVQAAGQVFTAEFDAARLRWNVTPDAAATTACRVAVGTHAGSSAPALWAASPLCVLRDVGDEASTSSPMHIAVYGPAVGAALAARADVAGGGMHFLVRGRQGYLPAELQQATRIAGSGVWGGSATLLVHGLGGSCEDPNRSGGCQLLQLELCIRITPSSSAEHGMDVRLGAPRAVLVLDGDGDGWDNELAGEMEQLSAEVLEAVEADNVMVVEAINDLVTDLSSWLQYATQEDEVAVLPTPGLQKRAGGARRAGSARQAPGRAGSTRDGGIATAQAGLLRASRRVEDATVGQTTRREVWCALLQFCARRGLRATAGHLLHCASRGGFSQEGGPAPVPDDLLLLAVVSESAAMVDAVVCWSHDFGFPCDWDDETAHGVTPLMLASMMRDGGALAKHILERWPAAADAWERQGLALPGVRWPSLCSHLMRHATAAAALALPATCSAARWCADAVLGGTQGWSALRASLQGSFDEPQEEARYIQYVLHRQELAKAYVVIQLSECALLVYQLYSQGNLFAAAALPAVRCVGPLIVALHIWLMPAIYARWHELLWSLTQGAGVLTWLFAFCKLSLGVHDCQRRMWISQVNMFLFVFCAQVRVRRLWPWLLPAVLVRSADYAPAGRAWGPLLGLSVSAAAHLVPLAAMACLEAHGRVAFRRRHGAKDCGVHTPVTRTAPAGVAGVPLHCLDACAFVSRRGPTTSQAALDSSSTVLSSMIQP